MRSIHCGISAVCTFLTLACGPIDEHGESEVIMVKSTAAALRSTPAASSTFEGLLEPSDLQPVLGSSPSDLGGGFALTREQEERDCTFQERADIKCPPGKLLGTCTVFYEEWADGTIHVGVVAGSCSIDAAPTSGSN